MRTSYSLTASGSSVGFHDIGVGFTRDIKLVMSRLGSYIHAILNRFSSVFIAYIHITYYGPGPHWGTVRKKMSPGKVCKSCVLRSMSIYTVYNDYYFQIIIEVAQLRQHKQRLSDLRTQLG